MSQSLSAEVLAVVSAGASVGRPERYEVQLDLRPEPGSASTRLTLVFQSTAAAMLVERLRARPPMPSKGIPYG